MQVGADQALFLGVFAELHRLLEQAATALLILFYILGLDGQGECRHHRAVASGGQTFLVGLGESAQVIVAPGVLYGGVDRERLRAAQVQGLPVLA